MAELTERYGAKNLNVTLTAGSGGVFDVEVDGIQVFNKKQLGRFPNYAEIPMAIDRMAINR